MSFLDDFKATHDIRTSWKIIVINIPIVISWTFLVTPHSLRVLITIEWRIAVEGVLMIPFDFMSTQVESKLIFVQVCYVVNIGISNSPNSLSIPVATIPPTGMSMSFEHIF